MSIDIAAEKLVSMSEASAMLPGHPSVSTLWRWRLRGVRGRKLECVMIGGKPYTSIEALQRFAANPVSDSTCNSHSRRRFIERAERELADAGL